MAVSYHPHKSHPWVARAVLRGTRKHIYLGSYSTRSEAQAAAAAFYLRKYGPGDRRRPA